MVSGCAVEIVTFYGVTVIALLKSRAHFGRLHAGNPGLQQSESITSYGQYVQLNLMMMTFIENMPSHLLL